MHCNALYVVNIVRDAAERTEFGRWFTQQGIVKENKRESDFVPFCEGTSRHRSFADPGDLDVVEVYSIERTERNMPALKTCVLNLLWAVVA